MTVTPHLALQEAQAPPLLQQLPEQQKYVAIAVAAMMLLAVLELVRRRKLREEYSLLWIATAVVLMGLALEPRTLTWFQQAIGAGLPTSALFFGALVFLMLVSLLMSVRLSRLTVRHRALGQRSALQQSEIDELRAEVARLRRELRALAGRRVHEDGVA